MSPRIRECDHYYKPMKELRAQIFANSVDNVYIKMQMDNANLVAADFRVKNEKEWAITRIC